MLYLNKFIALWLLPPGLFILILLGLACWLYKQKSKTTSWFCFIFAFLLYLLSTNAVGRLLLQPLEYAYTPKPTSVDAIIVLGGGATPNTPDVSGPGNVGPCAANRLLTALQLHKQSQKPIIFTGGQVFADSGNEGEITQRILQSTGVKASHIIIENKARNTTENALYTLKLAQTNGWQKVYLVTSAFHMPRSMMNFQRIYAKENIELIPYPCDYFTAPESPATFFSWLPQFSGLEMSHLALHEYLGMLALKIMH